MTSHALLDAPPGAAEAPPAPRRPRVLTIDDDPNVCQALKRRFARFDVDLFQACCGAHGIFLARRETPDVIVTDLRMPQGEGQHIVAWLKQDRRTRGVPVIVLTGLADPALREHLMNLGVDDYFLKPLPFETLCSAMRRFVDLRPRAEAPA